MENWSIVGPKFSGEDQFSMKKLVPRTKIFADQFSSDILPYNPILVQFTPIQNLQYISSRQAVELHRCIELPMVGNALHRGIYV